MGTALLANTKNTHIDNRPYQRILSGDRKRWSMLVNQLYSILLHEKTSSF